MTMTFLLLRTCPSSSLQSSWSVLITSVLPVTRHAAPGGYQPCCPQQGQGTAAFKVPSFQPAGENQFLRSGQENIGLSQEKPAALPPSQFFFVVKGCCDSVARAPLLLFFPTAPTQKFPRHWEQWPSSSTPRGFGGIHQEDGFMPLPLLLPAIWFNSHLCSGAGKASAGRLQITNLGGALVPQGRAAPVSPSPAFSLLKGTDIAATSEAWSHPRHPG